MISDEIKSVPSFGSVLVPVMPDLRCHTCDAQPARCGPDTAPPMAAWSCCIHHARAAAHSPRPLVPHAPYSCPRPALMHFVRHQHVPMCPTGSDRHHSPPMPPPSHPGSPHYQPCAPTLPLSCALTTCDIACHWGCAVTLCRRLLGDDVFLSNAAYGRAPLHAPCRLTCPSRCSTPSATLSSTHHRTFSGPAPSCTQSVRPHACAPAPH